MIHFVPAWYDAERPWYSTDATWFRTSAGAEADETVTQLRLFQHGDEQAGLVVLNYAPSLRRFLHGQSIFEVPYWSFFDEIQGLADDYTRPLDLLELEWPDDVSFHYNPFLVTVMRGDEVHARIYLAREGTLQSVRYYGDGSPTLERIYDDRGFLSSVLMHGEAGRPQTQYYLSRDGDVILSEDVPSGQIDVVQNPENRFEQQSYAGWEPLIREFLAAYVARHPDQHDTVVLALAEQHDALVTEVLGEETLVVSPSVARASSVSPELRQRADAVFAGLGHTGEEWADLPTLAVYPIEKRSTFGASANEATVYVSLFVDNITPEEVDEAIALLAGQLVRDEHTRLLLCTFRVHDLDHLQRLKQVIAGYQHLDRALREDDAIPGGGPAVDLGVDLGVADQPEERIRLVTLDRDATVIQGLGRARLLVDLGEQVNTRLAVEAVNAGVPQISTYAHELVTHPINGYVIGERSELPTAVGHFLDGLEHWNRSLVQCRVLGDLFSAPEVLGRWELIKEGVAHAGPADRA